MSIPTVSGHVLIEIRTGAATAETCTFWRNTDDLEDDQVYRYRKVTRTYSGGSWYEEWTYSDAIRVNDTGACEDPAYNSTFDAGTSYGTLLTTVNEWSDPVDPADVLAAAAGAIIWGDWAAAGAVLPVGKQQVFEALEVADSISEAASQIGPVVDSDFGAWKIIASLQRVEVRFTLRPPLSGTLRWRIGNATAGEELEYSYGSEQSFDLTPDTPTHTIALSASADAQYQRLQLLGITFLPLQ